MHPRLQAITPRPENDLSERPNGRSGTGSAGVAHRGRRSISSLLKISLFLTSSPPAALSATPARDSVGPVMRVDHFRFMHEAKSVRDAVPLPISPEMI